MTASCTEPETTPTELPIARVPVERGAAGEEVSQQIVRATRRARMGRSTRWTLAGVNLVLAVLGIALPVLQAWLHFLIAIALMAPDWPPARRLTLRLFRSLPKVRRRLPRSIRDLTRPDRRP